MLNGQYLFAAFLLSASFFVTIWLILHDGTARTNSVSIRMNHHNKSRPPVEFVLQSTPNYSTLVDHDGDKNSTSTDKQLEALLAKRTGVYVDQKPEWTQQTVLVTASNWHYRRMLFNWQCHAARYGLDYIVISMDPKIHKLLGDDRSTLIKGNYVEAAAGNFRSPDFNTITCNKLLAVHDILMTGRDVVFSDPDNVLVKDPFKDTGFGSLGEMVKSNMYDLIYSLNYVGGVEKAAAERRLLMEGQIPFYSIRNRRTMGNTGFYWMRSTPGNIALLNETIYQCIEKRNLDDQTLLWEVVLREIYKRNYEAPHYFGAHHCTKAEWEAKKSQVLVSDGERAPMRFCNLDLDKYVTGRNVTWPGLVTYHSNFATGYEEKLHKLVASTPEVGSLWVLGSDNTCSGWGRSNTPPDAISPGKFYGRRAPEPALPSARELKAEG